MIDVDFLSITERIKPLHGLNCTPLQGYSFSFDVREHFKAADIPFSRLHDTEYPFGSGLFADIHCIFPNFDADENDPESYKFFHTDKLIEAIIECGTEPFYRLGESIDHGERKQFVHPPKDYLKWARICEHIIAHYNEGWADGFNYGIRFWEIWNEPENPPMWTGTRDEYFDLYTVTANHLKNRFNDSILIGGYASCGFHALEKEFDNGGIFTVSMSFFREFLEHITSKDGKAPLDFFSFHIYTDNINRLKAHADFCRSELDRYGFRDTLISLNEWNNSGALSTNTTPKATAFFGAIMCAAQRLPIDSTMFYGSGHTSHGYDNVFDSYTATPLRPYYAFLMFNKLYHLGYCAESSCTEDGVELCAAVGKEGKAILICNPGFANHIDLNITGAQEDFKIIVSDRDSLFEERGTIRSDASAIDITENSVTLLITAE